jgi:DNA-binding transcriptional MerR regulator
MITIGQVADYAGVTIKAVRHYHQRGLLDEPPRDASGYRRYTAEHAVRLIKIRTLAEAGVPLARIKELLGADPDQFAAAATEIDRRLRERIEELRRTRERVAQLRTGDRLFVPAHVADFLDLLRELGVSPRGVQIERDAWILVHSASPDQAAALVAQKRAVLADPEFRAIYLEFDAALEWSPHDPRLDPLAERLRQWTASLSATHGSEPVEAARHPVLDPVVARLIAASPPPSPAWQRLMELTGQ